MMRAASVSRVAARTTSTSRSGANRRCAAVAREAAWAPGSEAPKHLDGSMAGDYGCDPFGLALDKDNLKWYREAELQNARWAMLATAGVLAQEIVQPDVFFYDAPVEIQDTLAFPAAGLVAFQFLTMHWVEIRRWQDWKVPGSVDKDPIFSNNKLEKHEVGYPGSIFDPLGVSKSAETLATRKEMEIKHGRLAMLAWVGMVAEAQVTGVGPLEALSAHQADPMNTTVFSAVLSGGGWFHFAGPGCAIPATAEFQGITIPTPCLPFFG